MSRRLTVAAGLGLFASVAAAADYDGTNTYNGYGTGTGYGRYSGSGTRTGYGRGTGPGSSTGTYNGYGTGTGFGTFNGLGTGTGFGTGTFGTGTGFGTVPPGSTFGKPTPLVLDLRGDGSIHLLAEPVRFDLRGDGKPVRVSWPDAGAGFLFVDRDGDGCATDGHELFGDATPLASAPMTFASQGFAALAQDDANHDGVIDRQDPVFSHLRLWIDRNGDGRCQTDEVATLAAYGITTLALKYIRAADGTLIGSYQYVDATGGTHAGLLADIFLTIHQD